jgi:mannose-6-phosphate isomerase-like protein (cupin superfamily)
VNSEHVEGKLRNSRCKSFAKKSTSGQHSKGELRWGLGGQELLRIGDIWPRMPVKSMKSFIEIATIPPSFRENEHDGHGPIRFRRLMSSEEFQSKVDFIDYTIIPSGSSIGRHTHSGNEEVYFIALGSPLIRVQGEERRIAEGGVAVVHSGQWHELVNDTPFDVRIFVIQMSF